MEDESSHKKSEIESERVRKGREIEEKGKGRVMESIYK